RDANLDQVAPKSKQIITYYSTVNADLTLQDLVIQLIQWDFNVSNYERSLGQFTIPASYTNVVKAQGSKLFYVSDTLLKASVSGASLGTSEKSHSINIQLALQNVGMTNVILPNYSFFVKTSNGILYPLETSDLK